MPEDSISFVSCAPSDCPGDPVYQVEGIDINPNESGQNIYAYEPPSETSNCEKWDSKFDSNAESQWDTNKIQQIFPEEYEKLEMLLADIESSGELTK